MNADRLLALFERISEAPDAIPRLRRFILDLAVRGKLVEQDSEDEPAAELLHQIAAEKERMAKAGEIKKQARFDTATKEEEPFDVPTTWSWTPATYPSCVISDKDKKVQTKDVLKCGKFPVVDQGKVFIRGFCNDESKVVRVLYPLILFGDHTRETKLIDFDFVVGADGVKLLQPVGIYGRYYFLALQWLPLDSRGYGRHFKLLKASRIPLPPLAEQHRIVAKVDELMALCDQLEASRQQREQCRERLVASSLQRLNQPSEDPEAFRSDARFALQVLPSLTTTPAQIKQLRQTILNLAVRGKLVKQDPEDEPVAEILRRTNIEPSANEDFFIPFAWKWVSVGDVSESRLGKMLDKGKNKGIERPYLRNLNVRWFDFDLSDLLEMRFEDSELPEYVLRQGDVLICEGGEPGRAAVWDERMEGLYFQKAIHRVRFYEFVDPVYFVYALRASADDGRLSTYFTGTGISHFTGRGLKSYRFPLPPLAEQHRIVAKVDELMALCDQLEQQLSHGEESRRGLLEAVLQEALAGRLPERSEQSHAAL